MESVGEPGHHPVLDKVRMVLAFLEESPHKACVLSSRRITKSHLDLSLG